MSDSPDDELRAFEVVAAWCNDGTADLDMHHTCGWWGTQHRGDSSTMSAGGSLLDLVNAARVHMAACPDVDGSVVPTV
jgi:hypothetical protein